LARRPSTRLGWWRAAIAVAALATAGTAACAPAAPPESRRDAVVDTYFGQAIADPYRWLEDTASNSTRAWFTAQNTFMRRRLDALPGRAALKDQLRALNAIVTRVKDVQRSGDRIFFLRRAASEQHFSLWMQEGLSGAPRLVLDPDRYRDGAAPAAIDYYRASPNGQRIAVGIAQGGSEEATLRVLDVDNGAVLGPPAARARWAGPVWRFDSTVLFFTQQKDWPSGTPPADLLKDSRATMRTIDAAGATTDVPVFGRGLDSDVDMAADDTPAVDASPVSPFALGVVRHGTQREMTLYVARLNTLRSGATPWRKLAGPERGIVDYDVRGEWIYVVTNEGAPRYRVLRWSLNDPRPFTPEDADVVVAESSRVIKSIGVARDALYVQQQDAGYSKLLRLEFNVRPATLRERSPPPRSKAPPAKPAGVARGTEIALPFAGTIAARVIDPLHAGALLRLTGWTQSTGYYAVAATSGAVSRTALLPPARADFGNVTTTQAVVAAADGTRIPVSIVHARAPRMDGSARLLLDVYGAYGESQEPTFWPSLLAWIERGGVYVVAHVRGGGELGHAWHLGGYKATKANTWRDAIAVGEWLLRTQWTVPARLAITGGSAGGVAAGNALIDRPDLFAAMVSQVGFHDTLRGETGLVGPANIAEFGSVTTPEGFRDLLAMSSYARLRDGVHYPAALFTTGFNDPRVDPWDPGKMAARLQAINTGPEGSGKPVLLRVDFDAGHGGGTLDQLIDETTDVFAFLLWQTGAAGFAPR